MEESDFIRENNPIPTEKDFEQKLRPLQFDYICIILL